MAEAQSEFAEPIALGQGSFGVAGFARKARLGLALAAMALALGGCGNCGGWTFPWYKSTSPHACHDDPGPQGDAALSPTE